MIRVLVNHAVRGALSVRSIVALVKVLARQEPKVRGSVEVTLVGERKMQTLNKQFRGIDAPTDVLSFSWQEDKRVRTESLGEVYLCAPYLARQAKRFKVSVKEETARMLTHGLLHLAGYDHDTQRRARQMFGLQEKIVEIYRH